MSNEHIYWRWDIIYLTAASVGPVFTNMPSTCIPPSPPIHFRPHFPLRYSQIRCCRSCFCLLPLLFRFYCFLSLLQFIDIHFVCLLCHAHANDSHMLPLCKHLHGTGPGTQNVNRCCCFYCHGLKLCFVYCFCSWTRSIAMQLIGK